MNDEPEETGVDEEEDWLQPQTRRISRPDYQERATECEACQ